LENNKVVNFVVEGNPFGKERPRATRGGVIYTPSKTKNYEQCVMDAYFVKYHNQIIFEEKQPLEVQIIAYYPIPKSCTKKDRYEMENNLVVPMKKPDLDNVEKIIMDALNTVAYHDDAQVAKITSEKYYSNEPRVEVTVRRLQRECMKDI